jgi:hypothetical protein
VDESVVSGHSKPYVVFKTPEKGGETEEPARKVSGGG